MRPVIPFIAQLSEAETNNWLNALRTQLPNYDVTLLEEISADLRSAAEVAIVANPEPKQLQVLPNLRWIQSLWAGVEKLVVDTQERDFVIVRMSDPQLAKTMAEAVLAWTLYLHRDMPRYRQQQILHVWQQHPLPLPSQRTVGILGLGKLGQTAARTLVSHGFRVCGWSRTPRALAGVETFHQADGLAEMLRRTNILIGLLPLTHETQGLLDKEALSLMPKNSSLINFARGAVLNTDALLKCLDDGELTHAVLDVFEEEPLPSTSLVWSHPNITVLPHISAPTNKQTASCIVAENIHEFFTSGTIPRGIDRTLGY